MTSKEVQEMIIDLEDQIERFGVMNTFRLQLSILKSYKQDLERLEVLETSVLEYKDKDNLFWETAQNNVSLRQENEKLKKALELACKRLDWDCPCRQNLIDDLDCENRCTPDIDYGECWKKYFLKKVLDDGSN